MSPPLVVEDIGDRNQMNSGVYCVPLYLRDAGFGEKGSIISHRPNLSDDAKSYVEGLGASEMDFFHHVLAVLHDLAYNEANADALRAEGPRIPLPGWPHGETTSAAEELARSAARGWELARLLDPDAPVPGITTGTLRPEVAAIAVPSTTEGRNMADEDFALTAGWGHFGAGDAVMPGQGQVVERTYTPDERTTLGESAQTLGETTYDIYLNEHAYWRNVPTPVWNYKLGGYQVLKKWLSYREQDILARVLKPEEVQHFTDTARRIAAIQTANGRQVNWPVARPPFWPLVRCLSGGAAGRRCCVLALG